jgi:hypothetical protein
MNQLGKADRYMNYTDWRMMVLRCMIDGLTNLYLYLYM